MGIFSGTTIHDDILDFLNGEMKTVLRWYTKALDEFQNWEKLADDAAVAENINDTILPLIYGAIAKLAEIKPETEEVTACKDKFEKVLVTYKEVFNIYAEACVTQQDRAIAAGNDKVDVALKFLDEYNRAMEDLAKANGLELEYN